MVVFAMASVSVSEGEVSLKLTVVVARGRRV